MLWLRFSVLLHLVACAAPSHEFSNCFSSSCDACPVVSCRESAVTGDWRRLDAAPANRNSIIDSAEALAQESVKNGRYGGVPSSAHFRLLRDSDVAEWFVLDDGSFRACLPPNSRDEDSITIIDFKKSDNAWTKPSVYGVVHLCSPCPCPCPGHAIDLSDIVF